ncbi:MAG: hypothetical protein AB2L20_04325 [Mangrovibacterium sp.]
MRTTIIIGIFVLLLAAEKNQAQISPALQDAVNRVPIVSFAYPANRDRGRLPPAEYPGAYAYAFVHLPYAIDLGMEQDDMTGGYVNKVIVKFNSVRLSAGEERRVLKNAVLELNDLLDSQYMAAQLAGFDARFNFNRHMISRIASNGRAIIAIREIMTTQDLINKLVRRANAI